MARRERYPYRADVHRRLIEGAIAGRLIWYSDLGPGRGWVGTYLYRIAHEEDAAGRPPLTAIVVHKIDGRPGPGMLQAMGEIGFARPGDTEDSVWRRATAAVFAFWRGTTATQVLAGWRPVLSEYRNTWPRLQASRPTDTR